MANPARSLADDEDPASITKPHQGPRLSHLGWTGYRCCRDQRRTRRTGPGARVVSRSALLTAHVFHLPPSQTHSRTRCFGEDLTGPAACTSRLRNASGRPVGGRSRLPARRLARRLGTPRFLCTLVKSNPKRRERTGALEDEEALLSLAAAATSFIEGDPSSTDAGPTASQPNCILETSKTRGCICRMSRRDITCSRAHGWRRPLAKAAFSVCPTEGW